MTASELPANERSVPRDPIADASKWLDLHGDVLYRYARTRVGRRELAEDLVQETFLAAFESREPFRNESTARTWLVAILRRKIVDYFRRRAGATDEDAVSYQASPDHPRFFTTGGEWQRLPALWKTPPDALEARDFWAVLNTCLSKLPTPLAHTFVLREIVGVDVEELRDTLSLSAANVRVRLHRARLSLRECLERNWFGESIHKSTRSP